LSIFSTMSRRTSAFAFLGITVIVLGVVFMTGAGDSETSTDGKQGDTATATVTKLNNSGSSTTR